MNRAKWTHFTEQNCSTEIAVSLSNQILVVHGAKKIRIVICCIAFKTRISFKKHMNRGAHLMAPGPKFVEGGFVREFMLLLDGISVVRQSTQEREFTPVMYVTRLSGLCKGLTST